MTEEEVSVKLEKDYDYFLARVRRRIPEPQKLHERLDSIFKIYAEIKDHRTHLPLFSKQAKQAWDNLMSHVKKGCLSDHPDIPLYFETESGDTLVGHF